MNAIYRYLYNNEIIYIGKTDNTLESRINDHAKEAKFQPYLANCQIEYFETQNRCDTEFAEKVLIRTHNPRLNVTDRLQSDFTVSAEINAPWKSYDTYLAQKKAQPKKPARKPPRYRLEFIPYTTEEIESIARLKDYLEKTVYVKDVKDEKLLGLIEKENNYTKKERSHFYPDGRLTENTLVYPLDSNVTIEEDSFCKIAGRGFNLISSAFSYDNGTNFVNIGTDDYENEIFDQILKLNNYKEARFKRIKIKEDK